VGVHIAEPGPRPYRSPNLTFSTPPGRPVLPFSSWAFRSPSSSTQYSVTSTHQSPLSNLLFFPLVVLLNPSSHAPYPPSPHPLVEIPFCILFGAWGRCRLSHWVLQIPSATVDPALPRPTPEDSYRDQSRPTAAQELRSRSASIRPSPTTTVLRTIRMRRPSSILSIVFTLRTPSASSPRYHHPSFWRRGSAPALSPKACAPPEANLAQA
jgi:hypothetical protein